MSSCSAASPTSRILCRSGRVESKHYNLRVVDLPSVKKIRVTYHYPSWTGMKDSVEDPGGDLRAVEGTEPRSLFSPIGH